VALSRQFIRKTNEMPIVTTLQKRRQLHPG
jgi:hypothetical protein